MGMHVLFLVLALADTAAAQYCSSCPFYASTNDATRGCEGFCHCGTCGTGRVNGLDFCLCTDPSCSTSCPNYRAPPPPPSSRRRSSSYSRSPPPPPSYGSPPPPSEESGAQDVSAAEAEFAAASGLTLILILILYFFIAFFPCIVFLCAWNQCISDHQKRGEQPTCCAWATCLIIFGVTVLTTIGVGIPWLILPFFMIIPFCMDSCYEGNGRGGNNVTVIHQTQSPVPQMQMQPMQQMQPPPTTGIYAAPVQPQMAPVQAAPQAVVASAYAPPVAAVASAPAQFGKPDMGGAAAPAAGLSEALAANNLSQYEASLRSLGVATPADVADLVESDCEAFGMKKLEFKRLQRIAAAQ